MLPIVRHNNRASEINISSTSDSPEVIIAPHKKGLLVLSNDHLVTLLNFPIMKVVRAIRAKYPDALITLI